MQGEEGHEANTIKKTRFYNLFDEHHPIGVSIPKIAGLAKTSKSTAERWLRERDTLGRDAYRRQRRNSSKLGRTSKITKEVVDSLLDDTNPVRNQIWEAQIEHHKLPVQRRQL